MSKLITLEGIQELKEKLTKQMQADIAKAEHLKHTVVDTLPEVSGADQNTIYLVKKADGGEGNNVYDEYMLINSKFEHIGDTKVDLTDYALKTEVEAAKEAAQSYTDGKAKDYATAAQGKKADAAVQSVKIGTKELKSGTTVTIPAATQSAAGVMSTADKIKLDGIEEATIAEIDALFS